MSIPFRGDYQVHAQELTAWYPPSDVFKILFHERDNAVWLDSSMLVSGYSRFSLMGADNGPLSYVVQYNVTNNNVTICKKQQVTTHEMNIFDFLEQELEKFAIQSLNLPCNFNCGFVGYFGYELKRSTIGVTNAHRSEFPDAQFLFLDRALIFDHVEQRCYLLCLTPREEAQHASQWFHEVVTKLSSKCRHEPRQIQNKQLLDLHFSQDRMTYLQNIDRCMDYLYAGESYEICLTNTISVAVSVDPFAYYSALREINPAPYGALLKFAQCAIACSSMERFMLISDGIVETKPIKGTMRRGTTPAEDQKLMASLANEEKYRSENLMIVDLLRNDLGAVCQIGSISVPHLMKVETYRNVHQLVSTIVGKLRKDVTPLECLRRSFPGGSMTGAPKIRTVEIIDTLEKGARGIYSGILGYLSLNATADFNVVIRTAVITNGKVSIGVGGAIIALSNPEEEYQEMLLKAQPLLRCLGVWDPSHLAALL